MKKGIYWITRTAMLLALLVALQWATRGFGQIVTGSCVNAVLAVTALVSGLGSGLTVALVSPVAAWLLGIAPQLVTVPAIMAGNAVFVALLWLLQKKTSGLAGRVITCLAAAAAKFAVLYLLVVKIICGVASGGLMELGVLKAPMLEKLPAMFAWPQLLTALIGGGLALAVLPVLKKALAK